jgi:hypothetical protein
VSQGSTPPDPPRWAREAAKVAEQLNGALGPAGFTIPKYGVGQAIAESLRHYEAVIKLELQKTTKQVRRMLVASAPDNWDLEFAGVDLFDLIAESGICLVWAPRAEVIQAMLDADQASPYVTLTAASGIVLDDLDAVLDRARGTEIFGHDDGCAFAAEAIASARDGHWNAAQSHTASGLGHVLQRVRGFPTLSAARKKFEKRNLDDATMQIIKVTLLEVCSAKALLNYAGDPPKTFNRHATQHGERQSFSQANALAGMLLLVGWLREFRWEEENHPHVPADHRDEDGTIGC